MLPRLYSMEQILEGIHWQMLISIMKKRVKDCAESAKHSDFQKLWEVLMIRVMSEAICETSGSMINQHCGKNRFLQPENFNIKMNLKFNLGPLHLLDNFVKEIY